VNGWAQEAAATVLRWMIHDPNSPEDCNRVTQVMRRWLGYGKAIDGEVTPNFIKRTANGSTTAADLRGKTKLVTIYLDNVAYAQGKTLVGSFADKHGLVEEHLAQFVRAGWQIKQNHGFGGNSDSLAVRGWIVVLLKDVT
jgi:hypothetical protein